MRSGVKRDDSLITGVQLFPSAKRGAEVQAENPTPKLEVVLEVAGSTVVVQATAGNGGNRPSL